MLLLFILFLLYTVIISGRFAVNGKTDNGLAANGKTATNINNINTNNINKNKDNKNNSNNYNRDENVFLKMLRSECNE